MSIIIAILNAILQAISWILPISESGHSAIFHDFSGRADGSVWLETGIIHIGLAVGIVLASFNLFKRLSVEFQRSVKAIAKRELKVKDANGARGFLYSVMVSFLPLLLWLIPIGRYGFLYNILKMLGYNNTLLDDGIFLAVTGGLLFIADRQLTLGRNDKNVSLIHAVITGFAAVFLIPVSGMSLVGGVLGILVLMSVSKKLAYRYSLVMSVPVLLIIGIIEIATAEYKAGIVAMISGLVVSVIAAFVCTRVLKYIISKSYVKYFAYYDLALGVIVAVIGAVQLIVR